MGKAKSRNRSESNKRQHEWAGKVEPAGWWFLKCTGTVQVGGVTHDCEMCWNRWEIDSQWCKCGRRHSRSELVAVGRSDLVPGNSKLVMEKTIANLKAQNDNRKPPPSADTWKASSWSSSSWQSTWEEGDWKAEAQQDDKKTKIAAAKQLLVEEGIDGADALEIPKQIEEVEADKDKQPATETTPLELAEACNKELRVAIEAQENAQWYARDAKDRYDAAVRDCEELECALDEANGKLAEAQERVAKASVACQDFAKQTATGNTARKMEGVRSSVEEAISELPGMAELMCARQAAILVGNEEEATQCGLKLAALFHYQAAGPARPAAAAAAAQQAVTTEETQVQQPPKKKRGAEDGGRIEGEKAMEVGNVAVGNDGTASAAEVPSCG
jgi:hypothetical protein